MNDLLNRYAVGLIEIPTNFYHERTILNINHTVEQLKIIARRNNLKLSGNKTELKNRIYSFMFLSSRVKKIQSLFRGYLQRLFVSLCGPAFKKRSLCTNDTDFITLDDLASIAPNQFFSYCDKDGFIYGFDIVSLYQMLCKRETMLNPYTRRPIPSTIINDVENIFGLNIVMKRELSLVDKYVEVSQHKTIEFRALALFQNIDALGNYSDCRWFLSLRIPQLHMFLRELRDMFNYRLQLTNDKKCEVCPPLGNPFNNMPNVINDIDEFRDILLSVMEKFVNSGINQDSKCLGAFYVLSALTIVSESAAVALPWLYQSTVY